MKPKFVQYTPAARAFLDSHPEEAVKVDAEVKRKMAEEIPAWSWDSVGLLVEYVDGRLIVGPD